jgi:hypothetical protein
MERTLLWYVAWAEGIGRFWTDTGVSMSHLWSLSPVPLWMCATEPLLASGARMVTHSGASSAAAGGCGTLVLLQYVQH